MKNIILVFMILSLSYSIAQERKNETTVRTSKYEKEADSIRKKHLAPHSDSVKESEPKPMPNARPDSSGLKMPVKDSPSDDNMPVKELPDSLRRN